MAFQEVPSKEHFNQKIRKETRRSINDFGECSKVGRSLKLSWTSARVLELESWFRSDFKSILNHGALKISHISYYRSHLQRVFRWLQKSSLVRLTRASAVIYSPTMLIGVRYGRIPKVYWNTPLPWKIGGEKLMIVVKNFWILWSFSPKTLSL